MSFGRIESGGNQAKDSITQLAETMQRKDMQTDFDRALKDEQKKNDSTTGIQDGYDAKKSENSQGSQRASNSDHPNRERRVGEKDRENTDKDDKTSDVKEAAAQEKCEKSGQATSNSDETSTDGKSPATGLENAPQDITSRSIEEALNQSDLLLLSLLIQPTTIMKPQDTKENPDDGESAAQESAQITEITLVTNATAETAQTAEAIGPNQPQTVMESSVQTGSPSDFISALDPTEGPQVIELNTKAAVGSAVNTTQKNLPSSEDEGQLVDQPENTLPGQGQALSTPKPESQKTSRELSNDGETLTPVANANPEPKRKLRLDELIHELRHPEQVLARKEAAIQATKKSDILAAQTVDRERSIQNQVLSALKTIIDRHEEKMTIHLDPPEWGKIDVQMKLQNKELNLQIKTEHLFVKESLEKGIPELRQAFSGNLQLGQLHIGVGQQNAQEKPSEEPREQQAKQVQKKQTTRTHWRDPRSSIVDRVI